MATEKSPASQKTSQRRKKAAVLALAGVVGIGAAATMANWTDEESVEAKLEAGEFDLQIATTEKDEEPAATDWEDSDKVEALTDLGLKTGPWGPGDYDEAYIHVRLEPGTTHSAQLTSTRVEEDPNDYWTIDDNVADVTLIPGERQTFHVPVQMDPSALNSAQGAPASVRWDFNATQLSENN